MLPPSGEMRICQFRIQKPSTNLDKKENNKIRKITYKCV